MNATVEVMFVCLPQDWLMKLKSVLSQATSRRIYENEGIKTEMIKGIMNNRL